MQGSFQLQGRQAGRTVGEALGRAHWKTPLQGTGSMSCFSRGSGRPSSPDWREGRGPSLQGDAHSHLQGWGFGTSFSPGSHSEDPGILVKIFTGCTLRTSGRRQVSLLQKKSETLLGDQRSGRWLKASLSSVYTPVSFRTLLNLLPIQGPGSYG